MPGPMIRSKAIKGSVVAAVDDRQQVEVDCVRLAGVARRTAEAEGAYGEISVTLVDESEMAALNSRHRGKDSATDVLSFQIDGLQTNAASHTAPVLIGEVVICPQIAQASKQDFEKEMDLLCAHGVLHLLGYDHDTDKAAALMREREQASVGISGATA